MQQFSWNAFLRKNYYLLAGVFLSVILTLLKIKQTVNINPDAVYYLRSAEAYGNAGLIKAMIVYPWPLYAMLISWLHKLTSLSLLHTAYTLNIIFQSMMLVGFWCVLNELSGFHYVDRQKLQLITLLVFLAYPALNEYRSYIVRDFGYWSFSLFALHALMRFSLTKKWYFALLWGALALIAGAFRIEGILIALLLPACLFLDGERSVNSRFKDFCLAQGVTSLITLSFIVLFCTHSAWHTAEWLSSHLGRLYELFTVPLVSIKSMHTNHHQFIKTLSQGILTVHVEKNAATIFFYGILGVYLTKFTQCISLLYLGLAGYSFKQRLFPCREKVLHVLYSFILLNLIFTLLFTYIHYFISGRYLVLLALAVILGVPFSLLRIYHHWESRTPAVTGRWWLLPLISIWFLSNALSGLVEAKHKHHYIYRAGHWLSKTVPATTPLYTNDQRVLYYARGSHADWVKDMDYKNELKLIHNNDWHSYQYLAIRINRGEHEREAWLRSTLATSPVKIFTSHQGNKILIFKNTSTSQVPLTSNVMFTTDENYKP